MFLSNGAKTFQLEQHFVPPTLHSFQIAQILLEVPMKECFASFIYSMSWFDTL